MPVHFSAAALKFLRGLKRHNDRAWFEERRGVFEGELKGPMLALIDEVNEGMRGFAPEHVRPPAKCMMRIYRDTRFSKDKRPYKDQVVAWWAREGLEKTSGAGFYFHLSGAEVTIAGGMYLPEREQMLAVRRHLLERHEEMRSILQGVLRKSRRISPPLEGIDGQKLTRAPKGFPADHPAIDLIVQKQWGVSSTLPAERALEPSLVEEIVSRFRSAAPLVAFLNAPLAVRSRTPMF